MNSTNPTKRPTDAEYLDEDDRSYPRELLNLPWFDGHNHAHTLSWDDRERYALSGCEGMVMVASGYHWTPYKPVRAEDVRFLWDDAINRRAAIERNHFFEARLGLGIHTGVRIENPDELVEAMDRYCELDEVVAVGETGVTPAQHVEAWDVDEQRAIVRAQMELADRHGLPIILHTPNQSGSSGRSYRPEFGIPGYEKNTSLGQDPVITGENPALRAVEMDVEERAPSDCPRSESSRLTPTGTTSITSCARPTATSVSPSVTRGSSASDRRTSRTPSTSTDRSGS
nr:TatD family hydrolase [Haladaptatus sp. R4]